MIWNVNLCAVHHTGLFVIGKGDFWEQGGPKQSAPINFPVTNITKDLKERLNES